MNGIQGFYIGGGIREDSQARKTLQQARTKFASQREKFERDNQNQNRQTRVFCFWDCVLIDFLLKF